MAGIEFQLPFQLPQRIVGITVFPVEVAEPEMNARQIGVGSGHGEILGGGFIVFLAAGVKLAQHLMHMIRVGRDL